MMVTFKVRILFDPEVVHRIKGKRGVERASYNRILTIQIKHKYKK